MIALENNNGLVALNCAPRLKHTPFDGGAILSWTGSGALQSATNVVGPYVDTAATSPHTNTAASQFFFRVRR